MQELLLFKVGKRQLGLEMLCVSGIHQVNPLLAEITQSDYRSLLIVDGKETTLYNLSVILGEENPSQHAREMRLIRVGVNDHFITFKVDQIDGPAHFRQDQMTLLPSIFQKKSQACFPYVLSHRGALTLILNPRAIEAIVTELERTDSQNKPEIMPELDSGDDPVDTSDSLNAAQLPIDRIDAKKSDEVRETTAIDDSGVIPVAAISDLISDTDSDLNVEPVIKDIADEDDIITIDKINAVADTIEAGSDIEDAFDADAIIGIDEFDAEDDEIEETADFDDMIATASAAAEDDDIETVNEIEDTADLDDMIATATAATKDDDIETVNEIEDTADLDDMIATASAAAEDDGIETVTDIGDTADLDDMIAIAAATARDDSIETVTDIDDTADLDDMIATAAAAIKDDGIETVTDIDDTADIDDIDVIIAVSDEDDDIETSDDTANINAVINADTSGTENEDSLVAIDIVGIDDFDKEEVDIELFHEIDLISEDDDIAETPEITEPEDESGIAETSPDIEVDVEEQYQTDDGMNRMISLIKDFDFDADVNFPKDFRVLDKNVATGKKDGGSKHLPKRKLSAAEDLFSAVALYHAPPEAEVSGSADVSSGAVVSQTEEPEIAETADRTAIAKPAHTSVMIPSESSEMPKPPPESGELAAIKIASPEPVNKTPANRPMIHEEVTQRTTVAPHKLLSEISISGALDTEALSLSPESEQDAFLQKLDHSLKNIIENENFDIKLEKVVTRMVKNKMARKKVGRKLANAFEECILKGVKDFKGT